jgi:heme O synthase-like polyprenyltransferase
MSDRAVGAALVLLSGGAWLYYSAWVLGVPFLPSAHPAHAFFPDRRWALLLPAYAIVLLCALVAAIVGKLMLSSRKKA